MMRRQIHLWNFSVLQRVVTRFHSQGHRSFRTIIALMMEAVGKLSISLHGAAMQKSSFHFLKMLRLTCLRQFRVDAQL
jgi:hypothetical protein